MFIGSLRATEANPDGLTGLSGVAADVIAAIGEVGVGLLTFVETVFPPIPSEIILPLSGHSWVPSSCTGWVLCSAKSGLAAG